MTEPNEDEILAKDILEMSRKMQNVVNTAIDCYKSLLLDEDSVKILLERIGEIPSIERPANEHKTDT
jgi:hypothetical protein